LGAGTVAKGGDDLAAFAAVVRAGFQLVYEPAAIVWHLHRREEAGIERQAFGYGIGLGAYLTKMLIDEPQLVGRFAMAVPAAARHIFGSGSTKNSRLPSDYPASLKRREWLGILFGPVAYARSRFSVAAYDRKLRRRAQRLLRESSSA
jgi:hypothetical protein